jgi:flagellar biosynthesis protein FlhB
LSDEGPSKEERTEEATGKRWAEAWTRGDIPLGRDFATAAALATGAYMLQSSALELRDSLIHLMGSSLQNLHRAQARELLPMVKPCAWIVTKVAIGTAVAAIAVMAYQTKGHIWTEKMMPNFGKVFSLGKITGLISKDTLKDIGVSLLKLLGVSVVLWTIFRDAFVTLPRLLTASPGEQLAALFGPLSDGMVKIVTVMVILAGIDLAVVKRRYRENMKMTKQEVKREYREDEGDPAIKKKRRRKHIDVIRGHIRAEVPKADALIVNPTHIAIAIRYRPGEDRAPRVTAKGKGHIAEMMRDLARENGIPIVQNIPLARLLFRKVKVGKTVPADTYKAVAAVLAFVYRVLRRSGATTMGAGR